MPAEAPRQGRRRRPHRRRGNPGGQASSGGRAPLKGRARSIVGRYAAAALAALAALAPSSCVPPTVRTGTFPAPDPVAVRAPAIPLLVQSPYLNVWLFGDRLTEDSPKLWNGQVKGMAGMIRVDGKPYRFLGMPGSPIPAMTQEAVRVWPTRTEFDFIAEDVRLTLEFLSPLDPRDLAALSLPLGYVRAEVSSRTGRRIELYLDITGEWAAGSSDRRIAVDGHFRIRPSQPRLLQETSNYPDWGEVHWAPVDPATSWNGVDREVRQAFAEGVTPKRDVRYPRAVNEDWPVFAHAWDLGTVRAPVARRAVIAHARREAILFYGVTCLSYWTKSAEDAALLTARAIAAADDARARAFALDSEVLARAREAGGEPLAALAAITFRQAFAANELVLRNGRPLYFSKSFDISGSSPAQAVDTLYAAAPALLAFNPGLLTMQLEAILESMRRGGWHERYAPRDLGVYPRATGPASPDENRVETSSMLLLLAAVARRAEPEALDDYRPVLQALANYLLDTSNPETWSGADASATLSSVLALATLPGSFLAARDRMAQWIRLADAGDHTALSCRTPGGWSLKRHYLADRLLALGLVPPDLVARDLAFARARAGKFGIPLDGQGALAGVDVDCALAALAPEKVREALLADVLRAMEHSPSRVPAGDRYETDTARIVRGQARSTLGSVFAPIVLRERAAQR